MSTYYVYLINCCELNWSQKMDHKTPRLFIHAFLFRNGDQLVLINGTFLPTLGHKKVLELFKNVPVDSHTRLSLVSSLDLVVLYLLDISYSINN